MNAADDPVKFARWVVSQVCGTFGLEGVAFSTEFKAQMMATTLIDVRKKLMGWASGSQLMSEIIDECKSAIKPKKARKAFYKQMIHLFEQHDCDTLDECRDDDPLFAEALDEMQW